MMTNDFCECEGVYEMASNEFASVRNMYRARSMYWQTRAHSLCHRSSRRGCDGLSSFEATEGGGVRSSCIGFWGLSAPTVEAETGASESGDEDGSVLQDDGRGEETEEEEGEDEVDIVRAGAGR